MSYFLVSFCLIKSLTVSQCVRVWDNIMCWPPTPAGQLAVLPCPSHIKNIDTTSKSTNTSMQMHAWSILKLTAVTKKKILHTPFDILRDNNFPVQQFLYFFRKRLPTVYGGWHMVGQSIQQPDVDQFYPVYRCNNGG